MTGDVSTTRGSSGTEAAVPSCRYTFYFYLLCQYKEKCKGNNKTHWYVTRKTTCLTIWEMSLFTFKVSVHSEDQYHFSCLEGCSWWVYLDWNNVLNYAFFSTLVFAKQPNSLNECVLGMPVLFPLCYKQQQQCAASETRGKNWHVHLSLSKTGSMLPLHWMHMSTCTMPGHWWFENK